MKSRKVMIFAGIIAVLAIVFAALHLNTRTEVPEFSVLVSTEKDAHTVDITKLKYEPVSGVRVNGKGEEKPVEGDGIYMKNLLASLKITEYEKVSVVADDSYSADVNVEEINEDGKVVLMRDENTLRLVVFGDTNSKRSISNVVELVVE